MIIDKYGIQLRLAEISDADFILSLRTDSNLNQHLSFTSNDINKQVEWLTNYKLREAKKQEYYFVAEIAGMPYGTTRLYNFDEQSFETGSWLFSKETPTGVAIKADIIGREFGFEALKAKHCRFEVRKENKSVVRYHLGYKPNLTKEDELNFYFTLAQEDFNIHKNKLLKFI